MSTYIFEKSLMERLQEIELIIDDESKESCKNKFREFLESMIEPGGYSAIWRVSKATCEELKIKFPCEVLGEVLDTKFEIFSATFLVESVLDENVHLPKACSVPLDDLYPTIEQENAALNVDLTADCLDRYRFFFNYIYMPFDEQDENDFVRTLLEPRIKLFFDLQNKTLSKQLSSYIRIIIAEAKYLANQREYLENSIDESEGDLDISQGGPKEMFRKLLKIDLRMASIKNEYKILVNPEIRDIFAELKFPHHKLSGKVFAITKHGPLSEQVEIIDALKTKIAPDAKVHWLALTEAFAAASPGSEIYIPSGDYKLNFLEYIGQMLICGLPPVVSESVDINQIERYATISSDCGPMLFAVDGDLTLQNLVINCEEVKTGLMVKGGSVTIENCVIYGSKESSITEAFSVTGDTSMLLKNCLITNFATGLSIDDLAKINIRNCVIANCNVGVQVLSDDAKVSIEGSSFLNCSEFAILKYSTRTQTQKDVTNESLNWNDEMNLNANNITLLGGNNFNQCGTNIKIATKYSEKLPVYDDSEDFNNDVSM